MSNIEVIKFSDFMQGNYRKVESDNTMSKEEMLQILAFIAFAPFALEVVAEVVNTVVEGATVSDAYLRQ